MSLSPQVRAASTFISPPISFRRRLGLRSTGQIHKIPTKKLLDDYQRLQQRWQHLVLNDGSRYDINLQPKEVRTGLTLNIWVLVGTHQKITSLVQASASKTQFDHTSLYSFQTRKSGWILSSTRQSITLADDSQMQFPPRLRQRHCQQRQRTGCKPFRMAGES